VDDDKVDDDDDGASAAIQEQEEAGANATSKENWVGEKLKKRYKRYSNEK
jgi:hypothetical protein